MKISLNWIRDYVPLDAAAPDVTHALTFLGFEVEQVAAAGAPPLENVVVGEVLTSARHPNADKLSVCTVDAGPAAGVKTIVCGAHNYKVGDRVAVALPGAVLPGGREIKSSKIRGQLSDGMMCSGRELGIGDDADGILVLDRIPRPAEDQFVAFEADHPLGRCAAVDEPRGLLAHLVAVGVQKVIPAQAAALLRADGPLLE